MMSVSSLSWSEERQQSLNAHLQGFFASDAWRVGPPHKPEKQSTLDFSPLQSSPLKIELKYAVDPEVQLVRKGIRGQTLPIGGCGRLVVLGECNYANKCVTCPMWLTSTDDLPALKSFYERANRLRQRAQEVGNQVVVQQQTHNITNLTVRLKSLEEPVGDGTLDLDSLLTQLRTDLAEAEAGLEEAQTAGLLLAAKHLERVISELKARLAALEGTHR